MAQREQAFADAVLRFLRGIERAEQVTELDAGHPALELGAQQARGDERVLIEQDLLVEPDVGDADRLLVAERAVVAEDRHLAERMLFRGVERAVTVVVADRVGRREQREPTGVEERIEPRPVLPRNRDRPRDGDRHRQALADGLVEKGPQPPQVRAAERRQAVLEDLVEVLEVGDGTRDELAALAGRSRRARVLPTLVVLARGGHGPRVYGRGRSRAIGSSPSLCDPRTCFAQRHRDVRARDVEERHPHVCLGVALGDDAAETPVPRGFDPSSPSRRARAECSAPENKVSPRIGLELDKWRR